MADQSTITDLIKFLRKVPTEKPTPPSPRATKLSEAVQGAIDKMPQVFGKLQMTEPRKLNDAEIGVLVDEMDSIKVIKKTMADREKSLREYALAHGDQIAPKDSPLDSAGHKVWKGEVASEDGSATIKYTARAGSPSFSHDKLQELVKAGELTHKEYLGMTTQVRVMDEIKILTAVTKNPRLKPIVAKAIETGTPSVSVTVQKH